MSTKARALRVKATRKAGKEVSAAATGYEGPAVNPKARNRAGARVRKPLRPIQKED
jgi:hypothetical protein